MYIYDCSLLDIFKFIADAMPHRLLWTLVAFVAYFIIEVVFHYTAIGVGALCNKRKRKKDNDQNNEKNDVTPATLQV